VAPGTKVAAGSANGPYSVTWTAAARQSLEWAV